MWNALLLILLLIPSQWGRDNDRLPWGQGAWSSVSWQHQMLRSYQSIHGALPDSAYTELYDRLSPEEVNPEPTAPNAAPGVLGLADIAAILAWNAANGGRVRVYYNP
jgi:hypothetical protein